MKMTNAMVMNKAWEIARKGQRKFGGKVIEYIAAALKMAWALVKKEEKQMDQVNGYEIVERNYNINAWQKYGHKRVYFEGYFIFNDHEVNANKRVNFKGFFDAVNGKVVFQSGQARYRDFIKDVIRDEVNEVIRSMNNRDNDNDEGKRDFGMIYEGY